MSIIYSLIARGTTVLVDYTESTGNFQQITSSILQKIPLDDDTKCTYVSGSYHFHVIVDDGITYLCMADEEFGKRQPYAFLEEIKRRFANSSLKQRARTAHANEFRRDFGQVLASQMSLFSEPGHDDTDQISKVRREVNEVKDVMTHNIAAIKADISRPEIQVQMNDRAEARRQGLALGNYRTQLLLQAPQRNIGTITVAKCGQCSEKVLERGERIDVLVGKTEELDHSSQVFHRQSTRLRQRMWWQDKKMCLILLFVLAVIIAAIVLIALGVEGKL